MTAAIDKRQRKRCTPALPEVVDDRGPWNPDVEDLRVALRGRPRPEPTRRSLLEPAPTAEAFGRGGEQRPSAHLVDTKALEAAHHLASDVDHRAARRSGDSCRIGEQLDGVIDGGLRGHAPRPYRPPEGRR